MNTSKRNKWKRHLSKQGSAAIDREVRKLLKLWANHKYVGIPPSSLSRNEFSHEEVEDDALLRCINLANEKWENRRVRVARNRWGRGELVKRVMPDGSKKEEWHPMEIRAVAKRLGLTETIVSNEIAKIESDVYHFCIKPGIIDAESEKLRKVDAEIVRLLKIDNSIM